MAEKGDLSPIDLTAMPRDCQCITHEGLHWIVEDRLWFERNLALLQRGNVQGFLASEVWRLGEKRRNMARYVQDEHQTVIFPDGCSEADYNKRVTAVLDAINAR